MVKQLKQTNKENKWDLWIFT